MKTSINGRPAEWPAAVQAKWDALIAAVLPIKNGDTVTNSNYFTPRPYQDQYAVGSREEGFTYTTNHRHVYQAIVKRHDKVGGDEVLL